MLAPFTSNLCAIWSQKSRICNEASSQRAVQVTDTGQRPFSLQSVLL